MRKNHPLLRVVYILTDGDDAYIDEMRMWLSSEGWDRVWVGKKDVYGEKEDREIGVAVDMEVARRAGVFVGNGVGSELFESILPPPIFPRCTATLPYVVSITSPLRRQPMSVSRHHAHDTSSPPHRRISSFSDRETEYTLILRNFGRFERDASVSEWMYSTGIWPMV